MHFSLLLLCDQEHYSAYYHKEIVLKYNIICLGLVWCGVVYSGVMYCRMVWCIVM